MPNRAMARMTYLRFLIVIRASDRVASVAAGPADATRLSGSAEKFSGLEGIIAFSLREQWFVSPSSAMRIGLPQTVALKGSTMTEIPDRLDPFQETIFTGYFSTKSYEPFHSDSSCRFRLCWPCCGHVFCGDGPSGHLRR